MAVQLVAPATDVENDDAFRLLAAGIPLTLLLDLAVGPDSAQLFTEELADVAWLCSPRLAG